MIIFGAGIIGEASLHACRANNIAVDCFVDHRIRGELLDVPIVTLEFARVAYPNANYLLTSPNIQDMITPLEAHGIKSWRSCGHVLADFDIDGIEFFSINGNNESSRYSHEHIKYLIRTCLHHHENHMNPGRLTLPSVDLIVTERCSMKCRDCSNLMQYYERPENAELDEMLATIDAMSAKMDEIYEYRVIGGEPFMHKELHLVVEKLCSKENIQRVSVFTNATIVPRDHQWAAFSHPKVRFFITDYDELSRNIRPLVAALAERSIPYVSEKANGWTDCAALDKHNRQVEENKAIWDACCAKNLATLADGRLYRCPFAANAAKLSAVPDYRDDYLIVDASNRDQIRSFLREKTHIETCDHCNGRNYDAPVIKPAIQTRVPLTYHRYARGNGP